MHYRDLNQSVGMQGMCRTL